MLDFGKFCYLHVEKTGGTYISTVLKDICLLPLLKNNLHGTISRRTFKERVLQWTGAVENEEKSYSRDRCFYFNSVRNPFEYYASLYNYGCDGRGGVAQAIRRHVKDDFYNRTEAGFLKWTEFILDERKAELWHGEYSETCAHSVGLLTYRFLRLSLADPLQKLKLIKSPEETVQVFWRHSILNYTIRTESLNKDLHYLFHGPLRFYVDINRSEALLVRNRKVNASISGVVTGETLRNSSLAQKVADRDAFILDTFYQKS